MMVGLVLLKPHSLIGGEPPNRIASWGSTRPEVMLAMVLSR
jgi:hypothetical protein